MIHKTRATDGAIKLLLNGKTRFGELVFGSIGSPTPIADAQGGHRARRAAPARALAERRPRDSPRSSRGVHPHVRGRPRLGPPIGALPLRERWSWLVAPRSTILQTSAPHVGLCQSPASALDRLLDQYVRSTR